MWVPRDFKSSEIRSLRPSLALDDRGAERSEEKIEQFVGRSGVTHRLGSAAPLRRMRSTDLEDAGRNRPYMPLIIQACQEDQLAYEYRHGVTSYGAFTYTLSEALHRLGSGGKVTFRRLVTEVGRRLKDLGYAQAPAIRGPRQLVNAAVPWEPLPVRSGPVPPRGGGPMKKKRSRKTTKRHRTK
jgi:hypothetical protein